MRFFNQASRFAFYEDDTHLRCADTYFWRMLVAKAIFFDGLALVKGIGRTRFALWPDLIDALFLFAALWLFTFMPARTEQAAKLCAAWIFVVRVIQTAPFTINHAVFDAVLLFDAALLSICCPSEQRFQNTSTMIMASWAIRVVFFYAGIQKMAHGYYMNGEFLILKILLENDGMARALRSLLNYVAHLLRLEMPIYPASNSLGWYGLVVELPNWIRHTFIFISNIVVFAEIVLPLASFVAKRPWIPVAGLFALELCIAVISRELSFAFTTVACLLCFFPRAARWTFPFAFLVLVLLGLAFWGW